MIVKSKQDHQPIIVREIRMSARRIDNRIAEVFMVVLFLVITVSTEAHTPCCSNIRILGITLYGSLPDMSINENFFCGICNSRNTTL